MLDIIKYISNNIIELGGGLVAVSFIIKQMFSESTGLNKKMMNDYKERNEQLEKSNKDKDEKIEKICKENADMLNKLNLELQKSKAIVVEKEKHIVDLTNILQGRNPEILELLKEITQGNKDNRKFMETVYGLIKKSHETLDYQTKILEDSKERNAKIDDASIKHTGEPVLVPTT